MSAQRAAQIRVVGGTTPTRGWPAQAFLETKRGGDRSPVTCAATLVSARLLLTAGHCVTSDDERTTRPASAMTVALGSPILDEKRVAYQVGEVHRHPSYAEDPPGSDTQAYDIALLRLERPAPLSPAVEPLALAGVGDSSLWAPGAMATIIGWGRTCSGCPGSAQLLEARVPIADDARCAAALAHFRSATMVCAGDGTSDACKGDSGGPLMVPRGEPAEFVLVGVTSWGAKGQCASPDLPGVYARLGAPELNDWVRGRVPVAAIEVAPAHPTAGQTVQLTVTATQPPGLAAATFEWDLDSDGVFDDAAGPRASLRDAAAGSIVRVRASYGGDDVALARQVMTTLPAALEGSSRDGTRIELGLRSPPRALRVRSLRDGRLRVRVFCSMPCAVSGALSLDWRTSRRLGLTGKVGRSATLGRGQRSIDSPGEAPMTLHLSRRARRAIGHARSGTLRLVLTVRTGEAVALRRQYAIRLLR